MKKNPKHLIQALLVLLTATACERRDLWVYQDNFKQVVLNVDWRSYDRDKQLYPHTPDPSGMTLWFFPADGRPSYRFTSAQVNTYELYLSEGDYQGLVIDYSPEEYGYQEFVGMDYAATAKVQATPASYQPKESEVELFGRQAYSKQLPGVQNNGLYTVHNTPEAIASDTINMHIKSGKYVNYIPYEERDTYQESLTKQYFKMEPLLIPWHIRVRIPVKGIYYLYATSASIAGLADGYMLAQGHTSDTPCLVTADDWEVFVTGDNEGYIAKTFDTWGLRYSLWSQYTLQDVPPFTVEAGKEELRLNLDILLRDRRTHCYFHIDAGDQVEVFCNEYALSIDLRGVLTGDDIPTLPYVDAVNGLDFGGVVVPWEDGAEVDVNF